MNQLREISGRGLAVCDHYDATRLMHMPSFWMRLGVLLRSDKHRRAWIREVDALSGSFANLIRQATDL